MFNLSSSMQGTIRYNGIASTEAKTCNINRKALPLNKTGRNQSIDLKQKLNERLSNAADKRKHTDPYAFNDTDHKPTGGLVRSKTSGASRLSRNNKCDVVRQPDYEEKITAHSIISKTSPTQSKVQPQNLRSPHHEILQRIQTPHGPCEAYHIDCHPYQKHWFCPNLELLETTNGPRELRMKLTKSELRRRLLQIKKSTAIREQFRPVLPNCSLPKPKPSTQTSGATQFLDCDRLLARRNCDHENCKQHALPCSRFCTRHIMNCSDQVLFDYCTAKFADNTQCSVPVFDITHELPLCVEHARKRDNYNRMNQENKPKKVRKKVKPSAMIRPQKRSKKKKRASPSKPAKDNIICENSSTYESCDLTPEFVQEDDMVDQVLAMQDDGQTDEALVTQASRLLEETDISTVLNTIHTDEFNDFFSDITVNRNGEYEPSREETEELERALAAVDNDVKSLEKLSQQGLLDSLLDEHTLVESLVQIPDVFHNGYALQCGDAGTSRLLAVDGLLPQTHTQS